jgi:putative ABC transport system permease protein
MHGLLASIRYGMRLLLKSPGFAITAILILGFGIGANTAIFSLVDAVLLKPLPYPHPERLMQIYQEIPNAPWTWFDYPDYQDFCGAQRSFEDVGVIRTWHFDLSGEGDPVRLFGGYVSSSFFKVFSIPFLLGRPFTEDEDKPGGPALAVLNERIWRAQFNGDPNIVGKKITLDNQSCLVIGVAPEQIEDWTAGLDVIIPLSLMPVFGDGSSQFRGSHHLDCYGRLREGASLAQAQTECEVIQKTLTERYPDTDQGYSIKPVPLLSTAVVDYAGSLWLLEAAVVCLLLIACANVANLFLARSLDRRKEMNIRAAVGASRFRLIKQTLAECLLLSIIGGLLGMVIASGTIGLIRALSPQQDLARFARVTVDSTALVFCFGATVGSAFLFGLLPAWNLSKTNLVNSLKDGSGRQGTAGPQRQRVQTFLIIAQVSIACVLMIGAGLLARSLQASETISLGFDPHHLFAAKIELSGVRYKEGGRSLKFFKELLATVRSLPGVTAAALNPNPPFNEWSEVERFGIPGQPDPRPGEEPAYEWQVITPDYFKALKIPLIAGRDFEENDMRDDPNVVIIDQIIADRFFPGQDPIGKQIHDFSERYGFRRAYFTIVGVTKHVVHDSPGARVTAFQAYHPFPAWLRDGTLLVRTKGDPLAMAPAIRAAVASVDPTVALSRVGAFDDWIGAKLTTRRLSALLVSLFSGCALFLSAVGLYGVLAYSVTQRRREIGVRIAVGAQASNIVRLVMGQGLKILGFGLAIGLCISSLIVRFINSLLYGVSGNDPVTLGFTIVVLLLTGFLACCLPALRAARVNPITALRE